MSWSIEKQQMFEIASKALDAMVIVKALSVKTREEIRKLLQEDYDTRKRD